MRNEKQIGIPVSDGINKKLNVISNNEIFWTQKCKFKKLGNTEWALMFTALDFPYVSAYELLDGARCPVSKPMVNIL